MRIRKPLLFGLATLVVGLTTSMVVVGKNKNLILSAKTYPTGDGATYYNEIDSSLRDKELLESLQDLNAKKKQSTIEYYSMMNYFKYTDPGDSNGKIRSFYSGKSVSTSECNREHVWPDSHGGNKIETDIHMIRPALKAENENRGNSFYVEGMDDNYNGWDPANCGDETYRGDAARIIFYSVVAYSGFELLDVNKHHTTSENNDYKMGKLSDLLKWNLQYPVLQREKTRNEQAEMLQGNRNPFIDHPNYACRIWGKYNDNTKKVCGYDKVSDFSLSSNNKIMEVNSMFRLSYTIDPPELDDNLFIDWTSSDPSIASVSKDGLITTLKPGVTTITAKINMYNVSDSCVLTVVKEKGTSGSTGCGGNIVSTSILLSTISLLGIGVLLIRRKVKNHEE